MPRQKSPYPPEFRARIVELVRSGQRTLSSIAQEFEVTDTTIHKLGPPGGLDEGRRHDGLTSDEKAELAACAGR